MIQIRPERPQDGPAIEQLLDRAFGANRWTRPSYSLREGVPMVRSLCFVARAGRGVAGAIRFWPVVIGDTTPALLLETSELRNVPFVEIASLAYMFKKSERAGRRGRKRGIARIGVPE